MNELPQYVRGALERRRERPWNIKCCICGHTWMTDGSGPEDINCAICEHIDAERRAGQMLMMPERTLMGILSGDR